VCGDPDAETPGARVESLPDGKVTLKTPNGSAKVDIGSDHRRVYWATSASTGWKLILNVSDAEVMRPVQRLAMKSLLVAALGLVALLGLFAATARGRRGSETRV
jgi:hypothetical protein